MPDVLRDTHTFMYKLHLLRYGLKYIIESSFMGDTIIKKNNKEIIEFYKI